MKTPLWVALALLCRTASLQAEEAPKQNEVAITIHDSHGLSVESTNDKRLELVLFKPHTNIHLKISNTSGKALNLWQPSCPPGDRMRIEFREIGSPEKILTASPQWCYTGGMGLPKMFTLAAGTDILVNVDILDWWGFPIHMDKDSRKEMEMRAVYESNSLEGMLAETYADIRKRRPDKAPPAESVWTGLATTPWTKVEIINRTDKEIAPPQQEQGKR